MSTLRDEYLDRHSDPIQFHETKILIVIFLIFSIVDIYMIRSNSKILHSNRYSNPPTSHRGPTEPRLDSGK